MHFHLPKPLHGWRAFFGEVGIIVLGVLIALSAEQVAEWFHWQSKLRESEAAIARDLALASDLASERVAIARCSEHRLVFLRSAILASGEQAFPGRGNPPALEEELRRRTVLLLACLATVAAVTPAAAPSCAVESFSSWLHQVLSMDLLIFLIDSLIHCLID